MTFKLIIVETFSFLKYLVGDNAKENVFSCKTGLVCADTPDICADPLKFDAACSTGSCKLCTSDSPYACVSEKEFVPCSNGKLLVDFKQKCPSTAKFCGGKPASDNTNENTEEANKDPQWPCTSEKKVIFIGSKVRENFKE